MEIKKLTIHINAHVDSNNKFYIVYQLFSIRYKLISLTWEKRKKT